MAETRSILYLLTNVPLDPNYEYTMDFDTLKAQSDYFDTKLATLDPYQSENSYSYIKTHEEIKVPYSKDDLNGVNYFYFDNEDGKRWYAFILDKQYINPETTKLIYKIDPYQTFMFDYSIKESFVDREHQDKWELINGVYYPKFNINQENLELGSDYKISSQLNYTEHSPGSPTIRWIELLTTQPLSKEEGYASATSSTWKYHSRTLKHNNFRSTLYMYIIPLFDNIKLYTYNGEGTIIQIDNVDIKQFVLSSNAVLSMRVLDYCPVTYSIVSYNDGYRLTFTGGYTNSNPYDVTKVRVIENGNSNFGGVNLNNVGGYELNIATIDSNNEFNKFTIPAQIVKNDTLNSYPTINDTKNIDLETKLKTYPYSFRKLTDNKSDPLIVKNEYLDQSVTHYVNLIRNYGVLAKSKFFINDYNGDNGKYYNAINNNIAELPLTNNAYINYMSQNKAAATTGVAVSIGETAAKIGLGLATGGLGLAVAGTQAISTAGNIANHLIKMQDLKDTPDSIRQQGNNADFDIIDENNRLIMYTMEILEKFKVIAYNYFYHYGYKCNDFKIPNIRSRYYFNYIKTIGVNLETNIDGEYRQQLENIYNNGVTIWHYRDASTFKGVNNFTYENVETSLLS